MTFRNWMIEHIPSQQPARRMLAATLIDNIGAGIHLILFPLYLVAYAGISPIEVGACLTGASVLGLLAAVPVGKIADRVSHQLLLRLGTAAQAGVAVLFIFTRSVAVFALAVCLGKVATQVVRLSRNLLIAEVGGEERSRLRGQTTVAMHVGCGIGEALSVVLLGIGNLASYNTGFAINAASYIASGILLGTIAKTPHDTKAVPIKEKAPARFAAAVKDVRYATVSLVNGVLYFHQYILVLGLPLWIAATGTVPKWLASVIFPLNLTLIIALQMAASRRVNTPLSAGRAWRASGIALALACGSTVAADASDYRTVAIGLVIGAAAFFTVAEILLGAAEFELSISLAPPHAKGTYQGIFAIGSDLMDIVGPLSVALICVSSGSYGWAAMATIYAFLAVCAIPLIRWAQKHVESSQEIPAAV